MLGYGTPAPLGLAQTNSAPTVTLIPLLRGRSPILSPSQGLLPHGWLWQVPAGENSLNQMSIYYDRMGPASTFQLTGAGVPSASGGGLQGLVSDWKVQHRWYQNQPITLLKLLVSPVLGWKPRGGEEGAAAPLFMWMLAGRMQYFPFHHPQAPGGCYRGRQVMAGIHEQGGWLSCSSTGPDLHCKEHQP